MTFRIDTNMSIYNSHKVKNKFLFLRFIYIFFRLNNVAGMQISVNY